MFTLLFRKMRNTKWMILCLFIGFLLAAGMLSTVPIYMNSSLQRILVKDMQAYQEETGLYPGEYAVSKLLPLKSTGEERTAAINAMTDLTKRCVSQINMPAENSKMMLRDDYQYLIGAKAIRLKFMTMSNIEDHINLIEGRMFGKERAADGSFEVIVDAECLKTLDIVCGGTYNIQNSFYSSSEPYTVTIVGVFETADDNDSYWSEGVSEYINAMFLDYDLFLRDYVNAPATTLTEADYRCAFNYQKMDLNNLDSVTKKINENAVTYRAAGYTFNMGIVDILEDYAERADYLEKMLWVLQIPAIIMLAFYLFMVSQLNVEQEKNEIAVFKSRGASSAQIFGIYAMETGILGLATLIIAPFIGLMLCRFLGVSNGFLEFVNRQGLAARLSLDAVIYALVAVVMFFVTTMLPIIPASKLSIVKYKQSKTKVVKMSVWEKFCVDFILLGGSLVWYFLTARKINKLFKDGTYVSDGEIDPMYFIFAAMFIMGAGLLFIRLYPYLLNLIYNIGKRVWSVSQYFALNSARRSQGGRERFLMLFLVITFGLGIFSANTARAINESKSDRIYYSTGTDIVIDAFWRLSSLDDDAGYEEIDFDKFASLSGVECATRVLKQEVNMEGLGKRYSNTQLMAIEPGKFAKTAWFRNDLLPAHINYYLQALVDCRSGVLASRSLQEKGFTEGDTVTLRWGGNEPIELTILAFVDYFPSLDPTTAVKTGSDKDDEDDKAAGARAAGDRNPAAKPATKPSTPTVTLEEKDFIIANYSYIRRLTSIQPYQIWIKMEKGATSEQLYADIQAKRLKVQKLTDSSQLLIAEKTDPELQGMNGALTLGFVVIMAMTVIGFLIYWIISIRSRTLQFGVLRAMGVSFGEIIATLAWEQLLVSVSSIAAGIVIGGIASDLFVPMFRTMYDAADQVPPFAVNGDAGDYIKMYVIIAVMLIAGFAVLGGIIRRININKALKLGED